jgi:ribosomal protein S18 acetylase RimI-like enzyme
VPSFAAPIEQFIFVACADIIVVAARQVCYFFDAGRLDTMEDALSIYRKYGFYEIEAYYNNPADGVVYLEKIL